MSEDKQTETQMSDTGQETDGERKPRRRFEDLPPAARRALMEAEERRKELVKIVHKLAEEGKIAIRHARTEAISAAKKVEHVSDDDKHRTEGDLQKLHDEAIEQINSVVAAKEDEIMEV